MAEILQMALKSTFLVFRLLIQLHPLHQTNFQTQLGFVKVFQKAIEWIWQKYKMAETANDDTINIL
jgi:hypothetical protein